VRSIAPEWLYTRLADEATCITVLLHDIKLRFAFSCAVTEERQKLFNIFSQCECDSEVNFRLEFDYVWACFMF